MHSSEGLVFSGGLAEQPGASVLGPAFLTYFYCLPAVQSCGGGGNGSQGHEGGDRRAARWWRWWWRDLQEQGAELPVDNRHLGSLDRVAAPDPVAAITTTGSSADGLPQDLLSRGDQRGRVREREHVTVGQRRTGGERKNSQRWFYMLPR